MTMVMVLLVPAKEIRQRLLEYVQAKQIHEDEWPAITTTTLRACTAYSRGAPVRMNDIVHTRPRKEASASNPQLERHRVKTVPPQKELKEATVQRRPQVSISPPNELPSQ